MRTQKPVIISYLDIDIHHLSPLIHSRADTIFSRLGQNKTVRREQANRSTNFTGKTAFIVRVIQRHIMHLDTLLT